MNKLRLKNNDNCDDDAHEWKTMMTKNRVVYKMLNLIYIIALVTLLMDSVLCTLPQIEAAQHENITRLTKVPPPETSSLSDRLSTIFATSPTSAGAPRSLLSTRNNCTFMHENKLGLVKDQSASDYSEYSSVSNEDAPPEDNAFANMRGKIPVLGDPEESYRPLATCQTCNRSHDDIIAANLKSIHDLVLLKLGFSKPPNMTNKHAIPHVPQKIVDDFLKKHHLNKQHGGGYGKGRLASDEGMLGDDPNVMNRFYDSYPREVYEEEEDNYFPITERVYVFPKTPKLRHQSKQRNGHSDVLQFHFDNVKHSQVTKAILHVFVHSEQWLEEHDPSNKFEKMFNLTVHKVKRNAKAYQQLVNFHEGHIPKTKGHYLSVDVTGMVDEWYRNPPSNYGAVVKINGQNGHKFVVLNSGDREHAPYIEMMLEDTRKRRTKRSLSLTCNKEDNEKRCCRYPLMVDFRKFAWDWIIAPNDYMANYCAGECTITFLSKYMHTHVWQLSTSATPCCSPTKMAPLILLYYDTNYNVVQSTIPNMVVEKCSCS